MSEKMRADIVIKKTIVFYHSSFSPSCVLLRRVVGNKRKVYSIKQLKIEFGPLPCFDIIADRATLSRSSIDIHTF